MNKKTAIEIFGGPSNLAIAFGISPGAVSQWGDEMPKLRRLELDIIFNEIEEEGISVEEWVNRRKIEQNGTI